MTDDEYIEQLRDRLAVAERERDGIEGQRLATVNLMKKYIAERDSACAKLREIADWFLEMQHFERADEIYRFLRDMNTANAKVSGAGTASAGLPG
jgi:hypothetical protein